MKEFKSINDILEFAIDEEQKAVDFYTELADRAGTADMKKIFQDFAKEEISHKARLIRVKDEGLYSLEHDAVKDLRIADYIVSVKPTPEMTYQDALVLAMQKEKAAFKLYTALSEKAEDEDMRGLFMSLATEESKHKLRFEIEYDEHVLREN